ncbi:MAG: NAD(P)/FAD-dependent oxidoreductase [candidate division Zixibacteria bacterium]
MIRIAVIGAGPAGIFGAISAAAQNRLAEIIVYEATDNPLYKVGISGGGRCNVTNHCFDLAELASNYPRGYKELRGPFSRFQPRDTVAWFAKHGVRLKAEEDGRMFPATDKSSTIVDCLLETARHSGVRIRLGARVKRVGRLDTDTDTPEFEIELQDKTLNQFDRVLLATGGINQGHRLAKNLGHNILAGVPSLFTFNIKDPRLEGLAGTSFQDVKLTLVTERGKNLEETGPLLITHWGLSGPSVLKLSARGARRFHKLGYQTELIIDILPGLSSDEVYRTILEYKDKNGKKNVHLRSPFVIPKKYWSRIVDHSGIAGKTVWADLTKEAMRSIASELTSAKFAITGRGEFKDEFVTCGGIDLKEVDFQSMQSKLCPGLYFAGEVLDIDGITGGFNFQNAWTTGWIAGMSMAV